MKPRKLKRRRNRQSSKRVRRRRLRQTAKLILKLLAVGLVLGAIGWLIFSDFLKISRISCQLDNKACQPQHLALLEQYKSQHLLLLKPTQIESKLLKQDPLLASAQVISHFPNQLQAQLTSQENSLPVGLISYQTASATPSATPTPDPTPTTSATDSAQATPSATPTPQSSAPQLLSQRQAINQAQPETKVLTAAGKLITASASDQPQAYLLSSDPNPSLLQSFYRLYQELILSGITPRLFWLINDYAVLHLSPGLFVKLPLKEQSAQVVTTLQQIRSQSTINLNRVIIDLRFNQPVVSDY